MAWRSSNWLAMPNSVSRACSCFAAATASPRHAFSQPVSRMRCPAPAFTIHSRCSFSDAPINPCSAAARGLRRDAVELARKRTTHPALRCAQTGFQRNAGVPVGQIFRQRLPQRRIVERRYRAAADDAGIAVGGLAARLAPVDENDRHAPLPRGIGRRYADDARAEHHDISCFFRHRVSKHLPGNISYQTIHDGPPWRGGLTDAEAPSASIVKAGRWAFGHERCHSRLGEDGSEMKKLTPAAAPDAYVFALDGWRRRVFEIPARERSCHFGIGGSREMGAPRLSG